MPAYHVRLERVTVEILEVIAEAVNKEAAEKQALELAEAANWDLYASDTEVLSAQAV